MSPFDYILASLVILIPGVIIALALLCTKEDLEEAGVHIDDHNSLDLAKVYRDPIGFEPHGSRDTFVPTEVDTMSTDEFIEDLDRRVNSDFMGVMPNDRVRMKRALAMLIDARDILDSIEPCGHNDELCNKASNWLVRGHQD